MNIVAPDPHAIAVLLLTGLALFLFTRERIKLESSSLFILVVMSVGFSVFPYQQGNGEFLNVSEFFSGR